MERLWSGWAKEVLCQMILYFELVVRVERFGFGPIGMMCAWGHTCLIRDGYSGCVLGSFFLSKGLDVPVKLEGSPSEFLIQRKKSFVCFAYSSAFFWFLSLLFCYSSCHCVLLCVCSFVIMCITSYGLHSLHALVDSLRDALHLFVSCDCLFLTCITCVLVSVILMLCNCLFLL